MITPETRRAAIRWLMGVDDARIVARLVGPVEIDGDARFGVETAIDRGRRREPIRPMPVFPR